VDWGRATAINNVKEISGLTQQKARDATLNVPNGNGAEQGIH
jgi:hypothetical protein